LPELKITKRDFLKSAAAAALAPVALGSSRLNVTGRSPAGPPNVVLICTDDLGYGDLSCYEPSLSLNRRARGGDAGSYGSSIHTPNIDHLARDGMLFRQFNAAAPVCTPSRAAMLTGRYPARVGTVDVLFPNDSIGMPVSETTIAGMLKPLGYRTMLVGKWHLGSQPQFLPTNHGFDEFYGLPYSHDMPPQPLMHNTDVIEQPVDLTTLTRRYTGQAVSFIENNKNSPFFLYMAHFQPHIPLVVSEPFRGKSGLGAYGDAVQEVDWSVGEVLKALADNGLESNTLVIFTSDHGPWYQGSSADLRGRKGDTFEGGVRVPFIARFPGRIPRGQVSLELASNMDILPTLAELCGAQLPANPLDGVSIWPLLAGHELAVRRDVLLYFDCWHLQCARYAGWKLHVARYNSAPWGPQPACGRISLPLRKPELYLLNLDPGERYDVADDNPDIVSAILERMEALLPSLPAQVMKDWNYTMSLRVDDIPSGAFPSPQSP
jgi:arylsulfatase A